MGAMSKTPRGKLSLSIIIIVICTFAFIALLYTQRISYPSSSSIFKFKPCARKGLSKSSKSIKDAKNVEDNIVNYAVDDRFDFDPEECSVHHGKWVYNPSFKPLYSDKTCKYLDRQVECVKNGRNDSDYRQWEWQPDDCRLPRFNPKVALQKIRGKRLMFVGDSLQRGQWQSFVCLVESVIPQDQKSMRRGRVHSVFKAKVLKQSYAVFESLEFEKQNSGFCGYIRDEYNATIEFYWAPFLVESNSDVRIIGDPKQRILRVDSVAKHAEHWTGVDVLVFNTYVWWMSGLKIKSLWGSFANGEEGYEELDASVSYRIGLKTWANWVESNINSNKTRVFFTTMSPTHQRSVDWGKKDGIRCYNETKPVTKRGHWGTGSDKRIMSVVREVVGKMKVPVTLLNVTQLSEYRIDAHASVYTEMQGKLLNDKQKADPIHFADCIHWCLPGVPDTWNQIFFAYL